MSRLNSDIGEIQRVAAEAALAWVGNVLFLAGCIVMLVWLDWRLALVTAAAMPFSLWMLVRYRRRLEGHIADLQAAQRRHRQLPHRDPAGLDPGRDLERRRGASAAASRR